ncbi:MAG: ribosomal protein S21 component of cytosolic 80S ribosome and 40S small subunit [Monoraphidium minutum]|nr:MAG: ribosomal protein S21 component of cytosolic 80S ribosome and 40S small subunit [Monoraphidium minutum]
MKNDEGEVVDLYIPRKCAWTNKLITAKDHASVQINIGNVDANGLFSNTFTTYAFSGAVRQRGESDSALDVLWRKKQADA